MSNDTTITNDRLNLGIAAARSGRNIEARRHFNAVLRHDPHHIPALFWLAFVTSSPHDSLQLLEQILVLDPDNERAEAGIRWAKNRLNQESVQNKSTVPRPILQPQAVTKPAKPVTTPAWPTPVRPLATVPTVINRPHPRLTPHPHRQQPNPQPPLPKRRRWPKLALSFSLGVLGVLALFLSVMIIVPPETLAAWWPLPGQSTTAGVIITFTQVPEPSLNETTNEITALTSAADTILLKIAEVDAAEETIITPVEAVDHADEVAPVVPVISNHTVSNMSLAETQYASVDPAVLIGPDLPIDVAREVTPAENLLLVHQPATPDEKWIEVNVATQQITAWEGMTPVFSFIGSTGLPDTPTVLGKYHIYWKLESTLMVGPDYYLPEVPYTMYFYAGYALHGAYWHDSFGQPMSHGCVNLDTGDAKKLFQWADPIIPPDQTQVVASAANPGTLVVVHE